MSRTFKLSAGILAAGVLGAGFVGTLGAGAAFADTPKSIDDTTTASKVMPPLGPPGAVTPHVYEGTIRGNPSISLNCGPGGYVQRDPSTGPNIFDRAHIDDSGSDRFVHFVDPTPGGGVDWGHFGSLLATQISGNITSGPFLQGKHYKVALYCTSSQDDAWVINA